MQIHEIHCSSVEQATFKQLENTLDLKSQQDL